MRLLSGFFLERGVQSLSLQNCQPFPLLAYGKRSFGSLELTNLLEVGRLLRLNLHITGPGTFSKEEMGDLSSFLLRGHSIDVDSDISLYQ